MKTKLKATVMDLIEYHCRLIELFMRPATTRFLLTWVEYWREDNEDPLAVPEPNKFNWAFMLYLARHRPMMHVIWWQAGYIIALYFLPVITPYSMLVLLLQAFAGNVATVFVTGFVARVVEY